jgi:hypothetical protein
MAQHMLRYRPMSRTALALVFVAASASSAFAGGYVGLGIGTGAATSGDFAIDENGRSGRLMVGYRFGRISVEGLGMRYDMKSADGHEWTGTTVALAGKYGFPLGDRFEAFGRAGLQRTDVSDHYYANDLGGTGFLIGGGFEYRIPLGVTGLSFFVDYTILRATWESTGNENYGDGEATQTSRIWTLGATLSF